MGGKINKSAAIHTIKRILKNVRMILIINFRFCVDEGRGGGINVETSWRCVRLPKPLMIDCGCIFQIQSRLNLHEISAPQATFFCHRRRASPWRSDEGENLVVWAPAPVTNTFLGAFTRQRVSSPALRHVAKRDTLRNLRASAARVTSQ